MRTIGKNWGIALALAALPAAGCVGQDQLVGSDGSNVGAPSFGGGTSHSVSYTVMGPLNFGPGKCLPDPLRDEASCKILTTRSGSGCSCSEPGLAPTTTAVSAAMAEQLRLTGYCGHEGQPSCTDYCACEIPRAISRSLIECKTLAEPSLDSAGWCYVSGDAGEPQATLVADCPSVQAQKLRVMGDPGLLSGVPSFLACADSEQTVPPRALGEICFDESLASHFYTHAVGEVTVTYHTQVCSSGICLANHFQGLVGCPYGQAAGAGDCLIPGTDQAVSGEVKPQLVARQEALASICSCQCAGPGPGPYCTCPESMQCEHLVDDLHLGGQSSTYSGSYCIPKTTAYDQHEPQTECVEPNCGVKHPN